MTTPPNPREALRDLWRFVQDARVAYQGHHAADTLLRISERIEAIQDALAAQPPAVSGDEAMVQVATITGVDEYGPRLEWSTHWVDLGTDAKLYARRP